MEPTFSESALEERLRALDLARTLAFGAACSERLLDCYRKFSEETGWGGGSQLRGALDLVWRRALGVDVSSSEVFRAVAVCEGLAPDSEDFASLITSCAQDAVFGICSLLEYVLDGQVGKVVVAARYPTDSIDLLVQELGGMAAGASDLEASILAAPMMQQELRRQRRDLEKLALLGGRAVASVRESVSRESILDQP